MDTVKIRPIPLTRWELSKAVARLLQDQPDARYLLTTHGMPSHTLTGFHPVPDLQIITILDQAYVVIGHESLDLPVVLDPRDGRVLLAVGPASSGTFTRLSLYNSSLRQYRACAEAFVVRLPGGVSPSGGRSAIGAPSSRRSVDDTPAG